MILFKVGYTEEIYRRFLDSSRVPKGLEYPSVDYGGFNYFLRTLASITGICAQNSEIFFSQNIRDSLALFAIWRTGVCGTIKDPIDMGKEERLAQSLVLLSSDYRSWPISSSSEYFEMMPTIDEVDMLMGGGKLLHGMFKYNMHQEVHGETYGGIALEEVDSFWGNIPEVTLDAETGLEFTGRCLIDSFMPDQIETLFKQNENLKSQYETGVMENLPDFIPARRIAHPDGNAAHLRLFPETALDGTPLTIHKNQIYNSGFALWILAVLQIQYSWFLSKSFSSIS